MPDRREFLRVCTAALLAPCLAVAEDLPAADPQLLAELRRYLRAVSFGETLQGGIRKANEKMGRSTPYLDRVLGANPEEIDATVAPAFAPHLTLDQARAIADFYSSPTGRKIIAQALEHIGNFDWQP